MLATRPYSLSFANATASGVFFAVSTALSVVPPAQPAELAAVQSELRALADAVDALSDALLAEAVHQVVRADYFMPGCPPPADRIRAVVEALLDGKEPELEGREIKFG